MKHFLRWLAGVVLQLDSLGPFKILNVRTPCHASASTGPNINDPIRIGVFAEFTAMNRPGTLACH